jgi:hypothetical protein
MRTQLDAGGKIPLDAALQDLRISDPLRDEIERLMITWGAAAPSAA